MLRKPKSFSGEPNSRPPLVPLFCLTTLCLCPEPQSMNVPPIIYQTLVRNQTSVSSLLWLKTTKPVHHTRLLTTKICVPGGTTVNANVPLEVEEFMMKVTFAREP